MQGIWRVLQTMGAALTFAEAGEMLSDASKNVVLGRYQGSYPTAPDAVLHESSLPAIIVSRRELSNRD